MRKALAPLLLLLFLLLTTTTEAQTRRRSVRPPVGPETVVIADDFRSGARGWEAGFSDYSPLNDDMDLQSGIRPLPPEIGMGTGFLLNGHNRSDDLFMFLKKRLTAADGIRAGQRYIASFQIVVASRAGSNCAGIGGQPGESVFLKAGATGEEPRVELRNNYYTLSADKGGQALGGPAASVAGNIANNSALCSGNAPFLSIVRNHRHNALVTASANGELWLLAGTDSGFEGLTTLYYQSITATLTPVPGDAGMLRVDDDFATGTHGWTASVSDYEAGDGHDIAFAAGIRPLPPELGGANAFLLTGNSARMFDDLFLFMTKKLAAGDGVVANQRYDVAYHLVFASNAGTGCGSDSVWLKAGATPDEPRVTVMDYGVPSWRLTVDKGDHKDGGRAASTVSSIANGAPCSDTAFRTLIRDHRHESVVTANANGELWLLVGADSGYHGVWTIYIQSIRTVLTPLP